MSKQAVVGILAHVDAGKTTLAEAMLFNAGRIRKRGRVDDGDSHLDTNAIERERGITIFSSQAVLDHGDTHVMLVDAPGHVDFSAEAERTLRALDYAILVVGANDGVQGHTETLWRLLARYDIPTFIYINKIDLENPGRDVLLAQLGQRLSEGCLDANELLAGGAVQEDAAALDEAALEEFLEAGELSVATLSRMVAERKLFPCFAGSALKDQGVDELLDGICTLMYERTWPQEFAARVYRVSRGDRGERLAWVKVTGGVLRAKQVVEGCSGASTWEQKIDQARIYNGEKYELAQEVAAGGICAVTGLAHVRPGDALGAEPAGDAPVIAPVLTYTVLPGEHDVHAVFKALTELADEDPMLGVSWNTHLEQIHLQLMGAVQLEVVQRVLADRFGLAVEFEPGGILYKETISQPVEGVGHFEPLRHYAEVHLRLEPLPAGSGVQFGTVTSTDELDLNWQRLALTNAMERDHLGVLTGSPITDVRITLTGGRAHTKHTEGGDFRQATYRAIRQGLMRAREAGAAVLLEPWYRFELEVPGEWWAGRSRMPRAWVPSTSRRRWRETGRRLWVACRHPRCRIMRWRWPPTRAVAGICTWSSPAMRLVMMPSASSRRPPMGPRPICPTRPTRSFALTAPVTRSNGTRCPPRRTLRSIPPPSAPGEQQTPSFSATCDKGTAPLSYAIGITRYKLV